jgi:uncharacterized protein
MFELAADNIAECAAYLARLVGDLDHAEEILQSIVEIERRNDEVTRQILRRLNQSFVTPFDREDIHELTEQLDDAVDDVLAAADLLVLHQVDHALDEMRELVNILHQAAIANQALIVKLAHLKDMDQELERIDQLESAADRAYRRCVARLFSGEYDALAVLKLKDVVEAIESSVNRIENVSDIVESIQLKHA